MRKRGRIVSIVVLAMVGGLAVLVFGSTFSFGIPRQDYRAVRIDPSGIPDGSFIGDYRIVAPFGTFVGNRRIRVRVEVAGGRIQEIEVLSPEDHARDTLSLAGETMAAYRVGDHVGGQDAFEAWAAAISREEEFPPGAPLHQLMERRHGSG